MESASGPGRPSRWPLAIGCLALLIGFPIGLIYLNEWLIYRHDHPKDRMGVIVENVPPDTEFLGIACEDGEKVQFLDTYGWSGNSFPHTPQLGRFRTDGRSRYFNWNSGEGGLPEVRWKQGNRYAVVIRNIRNEWRWQWIAPADVISTPPDAGSELMGGITFILRRDAPSSVPDPSYLATLGISEPTNRECELRFGQGLLGSPFTGDPDPHPGPYSAEDLVEGLKNVRDFLGNSNMFRACVEASWLCAKAPRVRRELVGMFQEPSEDQQLAARDLECSYTNFVRAATTSKEEALRVADSMEGLIRRLPGYGEKRKR